MIAAIHQPNYLPYIGYFYKIARADVFVILDIVQYSKNGFINRNKIKTTQGEKWLTVGVLTKGRFGQAISELQINNTIPWGDVHEKSMAQNYARAPYFKKYFSPYQEILREKWEKLIDLNEAIIKTTCRILGIEGLRIIRASDLDVSGHRTELLLSICKAVGCNTYFSGPSGKKYMDVDYFQKEGVKAVFSGFKHPTYRQLWGDFIPAMSIIDLLFNEGEKSLEILISGGGHDQ